MKRLTTLLQRLPFGALTRRAFGETFADWRHESRGVGVPGRARATIGALAGLLRVAGRAFASFEEHPMRNMSRDVRHGLRRLRATPLYAVFAVGSLGIGIGASTAIYSLLRAVTAPPAGVQDVSSIVNVYHSPSGGFPFLTMSWPDYQALSSQVTTLEQMTAWDFAILPITASHASHEGPIELVGGNYFELLGVRASLGRGLVASDDRPDAAPVAVISHQFWQRLFAGEADVIGRTIRMSDGTFEIVGVAPAGFKGLFNSGRMPTSVFVPISTATLFPRIASDFSPTSERRWVLARGRIRPGHTLDEVAAEVTTIAERLDAGRPIGRTVPDGRASRSDTSRRWTVQSVGDVLINENSNTQGYVRFIVAAILAAVALVLLVACTNLANLTAARTMGRHADLAIRQSLGASRWRLFRESVVEQALVAVGGAAVGLAVARVVLVGLGNELRVENATLAFEPRVGPAALALCLGAAVLALLVAGVIPSLRILRQDARAALAAHASSGALPRWRGRRWLIAFQVTASMVLLSLAATFATQLRAAAQADTGVDVERLAVAEVEFEGTPIDSTRIDQIVESFLGAVGSRGDVEAVAVSGGLPFGVYARSLRVRDPQTPVPDGVLPEGEGVGIDWVASVPATPGIFDTLGVPVLRGRALDARDVAGAQPVAVVSALTARTIFGELDVLGRQVEVRLQGAAGEAAPVAQVRTIVGVVADTDAGVAGRRDNGIVYLPLAQMPRTGLVFSARATGDPAALVGVIRAALLSAEPRIAIARLGTGRDVVAPLNPLTQAAVAIAGVLGFFALVLALAGLYGVLAHVVASRTREIGLRMALGATPSRILRAVVRDGLGPVIVGLVTGLGVSVIARLSLQPRFLAVLPAGDLLALAGTATLFIAAGLLACYLPAARAARVDPHVALKDT
jgi:predicted permease